MCKNNVHVNHRLINVRMFGVEFSREQMHVLSSICQRQRTLHYRLDTVVGDFTYRACSIFGPWTVNFTRNVLTPYRNLCVCLFNSFQLIWYYSSLHFAATIVTPHTVFTDQMLLWLPSNDGDTLKMFNSRHKKTVFIAYVYSSSRCFLALLIHRVQWLAIDALLTVRNVSVLEANTTISMMSATTPITTPSLRCLAIGRLETISRYDWLSFVIFKNFNFKL